MWSAPRRFRLWEKEIIVKEVVEITYSRQTIRTKRPEITEVQAELKEQEKMETKEMMRYR